jgi:hypothetical protein
MKTKEINPIFSNVTLQPSYSAGQKFGTSFFDQQAEERAAEEQGFWNSSKNILGRLIGRAGLSVLETAAMLGYGLPRVATTGKISSIYDNELSSGFKFLDEKLREATPFYQTEAEKKAPMFSWDYATSTNFWGNVIGEGGGFLLGAAASGKLLGEGINMIGRSANSFGRLSTNPAKVAELGESLKTGNFFEKFISAAKSDAADNTAKYYAQRVAGNMYEASVEARGIKERILEEKERKWKEEHPNMEPPEALRQEWGKKADLYGNLGLAFNMGVLMLDGYNFDKFFKGYSNTNRTVNALVDGGRYVEKEGFNKFVDQAKSYLTGPMKEFAQEGGQFLTERSLTDIAMKDGSNAKLDFNDYFTSIVKGLEETFGTKEGQESMIAGFLLATPFNIPQAIAEGRLDKEGIEVLNQSLEKDTFQKLFQHNVDVYNKNFGQRKDEAALNNSHLVHENLNRDAWYDHVKSRDEAGRFDDILDEVYRQKTIPLNVFNELHGEEYTEAQRQKQLNGYEAQAKYYKELKENFDGAYTKHPNKEEMLRASFHIQGISERINELRGKLTNTNLDVLTKQRIAGDIQLLEENKLTLEKKLFSLLKGEEFKEDQEEGIPNQGEVVNVNGTTGVVEGRVPPPPPNVIIPPDEEPEEKKDTTEEPPVVRVSTPEGPVEVFPHEIEREELELDKMADVPEETLYTYANNPNSEFTEDIPRDKSKGEKGKTFVIFDENNPSKIKSFLQNTDFNIKDFEVENETADKKGTFGIREKDLNSNLQAKSDIIDRGEKTRYFVERQPSGNLQVFAQNSKDKYNVGYILRSDFHKASGQDITIDDFVEQYEGPQKKRAEELLTVLQDINQKGNIEITDFVKLANRVKNHEDGKTIKFSEALKNYANRWMINGQFLIVQNNNGRYIPIDGLTEGNEDLLFSELNKLYENKNLSSLGTQYAILVKRPDSDAYQFVGLKGRQLTGNEIINYKSIIKNWQGEKKELVNYLNNNIFLKSNRSATVDGKDIPLHLKFSYKKQTGDIIVVAEPKLIEGAKQDTTYKGGYVKMSVNDAIEKLGSIRVGKTDPNSRDFDFIKDNVETSAFPELWQTFFSLNHKAYLASKSNRLTDIIPTPDSTQPVNPPTTPPPSGPAANSAADARSRFLGGNNNPDNKISYSLIKRENADPRIVEQLDAIRENVKKVINVDVDLFKSEIAQGAFRDSLILLNEKGWQKGTEWHEAFHGVFSILPQEEKVRVLKIAYQKMGVSQEEIDNLRIAYVAEGMEDLAYDEQFLFEKVLEDKVADLFRDHMNGRPTTILGNFFRKLEMLIKYLLGISERDEIKALFNNIEGGKYRHLTPEGKFVSFSNIPHANSRETTNTIRYLSTLYLNRQEIDEIRGTESPSELKAFIEGELERMRNFIANVNNKAENDFLEKQNASLLNGNTTQAEMDENINVFYQNLGVKNYQDENGRIVPRYLSKDNNALIIAQVIKNANLRRTTQEQVEEDGENGENRDFTASEMEKSPQFTRAAQGVKETMSTLYYVKDGEVVPIDYLEVFNNLLLNFSGKDDVVPEFERLTRSDSNHSLSVAAVYNEYKVNPLFQQQIRVAFDKSFVNGYNVLINDGTIENRNFVKNANSRDYVVKQMDIWKSQIISKKLNKGIGTSRDIADNLGIIIEPDTLADPEAQEIIKSLTNQVRFLNDKVFTQDKDNKEKFNSAVIDLLTKLAEINIKYRLDLGELNFKNAKGKSMHSMIQNSWVLNKLRDLGYTYGIFTGTNINGDKKDYNDLDPKSYFYNIFGMYMNNRTVGTTVQRTPFYTIQQFEAKSTVPIFQGIDYYEKGTFLSGQFKEIIDKEQNRQIENFAKAKLELIERELDDLVEGYHYYTPTKEGDVAPKKIKDKYRELFNEEFVGAKEQILKMVEAADNNLVERAFLPRAFTYTNLPKFNEIKNPAYSPALFAEMIDKQIENTKNFMNSFEIKFDEMAKTFGIDEKTNADDFLKMFAVNNYLNKLTILAAISPDLNQFKNYSDITKRGAGLLASGPNHGKGSFYFGVVPDSQLSFTTGKKGKDGNDIVYKAEELDGQGVEDIYERINRYERLGIISRTSNTKNPKADEAYQRYLILKAYLDDDRSFIRRENKNADAVLKVDKTVGYGAEFYMKTSIYLSTRYFSSIPVDAGTEGAFQDIYNGKYYLPMPGREYEWNLLNEMQTNKGTEENPIYIRTVFAKSALKKGARSVSKEIDGKLSLRPLSFEYSDYRLQQENPSGKIKIKDGSQLRQLLESGFPEGYDINGKTLESLIELSDELLAEITRFNTMLYGKNKTYQIQGANYNPFTTYLQNSLETSASTERMIEFFKSKEGEFEYSPSMPMMKVKFEEMLMAYFNNNIASQKTTGSKYTIVSSKYYKVMELNGKPITTYEYHNILTDEERAAVTTRDLNYSNSTKPMSEIVLSEEYLDQYNMKIKDWIELKKAYEKFQETKIETEESRIFDKISKVLAYRIPTQAQHSMMPARVVDFLPRHYGSTAIPPAQITKMSGADYDVDSIFVQKYSIYKDKNGKYKQFEKDSAESLKKSLIKNSFISELLGKIDNSERRELMRQMRDNNMQIKKLYKEHAYTGEKKSAIKQSIDMEIQLLEEDNEIIQNEIDVIDESNLGTILSQLDESVSTVPERNFNEILDTRIDILTSPKGVELLNSPADDLFKDLYNEYFRDIFEMDEDYPVYSGVDTQLNEWLKVAVGAKAIGGAANMTKVFGFIVKNKVRLSEKMLSRLKEYFDFEFSSENPNEKDLVLEKYEKGKIQLAVEVRNLLKDFTLEDVGLPNIDAEAGVKPLSEEKPKSDTLSNNVTICVDNSKDQRLIEFNLNDKNIPYASTLGGISFGAVRLAAVHLNPIGKLISQKMQIDNSFGKNSEISFGIVNRIFAGLRLPLERFTDDDIVEGINNFSEIYKFLSKPRASIKIVDDPWDAQEKGQGISVIRGTGDKHYGNPFGAPGSTNAAVILEGSIADRVMAFHEWLSGEDYQHIEPKRREWILSQIEKGALDGKTLLYYKNLNEPSHADVLLEMVNDRILRNYDPKFIRMLAAQKSIGYFYTLVGEILDDNYTINTILNFNKEVGQTGGDILKIQNSIKKIKKSKDFSYDKTNILNNKFIKEVEASLEVMMDTVSEQLISYRRNFSRVTTNLIGSTIRDGDENLDIAFQQDLRDEFLNYLSMKGYLLYKDEVSKMSPEIITLPNGEKFEEKFSISDPEIINGNKVIAEYNRVLNYMKDMEFPIINILNVQNPSSAYPFRRLTADTFANLSIEDKQKLVDSFDDLHIDVKTRALGKYIITHIAAHDNFKYIANSLVDKARPAYFDSLNSIYKGTENFEGLEKLFSNEYPYELFEERFAQMFRYPVEDYLIDFGKFYFSDRRALINLKSTFDSFATAKLDGEDIEIQATPDSAAGGYSILIPPGVKKLSYPYFMRNEYTVYALDKNSSTPEKFVYKPIPTINSKKGVKVRLYQLPFNTFVNLVNQSLAEAKNTDESNPTITTAQLAEKPVAGINIISDSDDPLGAALTNPTTISKAKGKISRDYPVEFNGVIYPDAEAAYKANKENDDALAKQGKISDNNMRLMVKVLQVKLEQYPQLVKAITDRGGMNFLMTSSHTGYGNRFEGVGLNSPFIRSLTIAYNSIVSTPIVNNEEEAPEINPVEIPTGESQQQVNTIQREITQGTDISGVENEKLFDPNDKVLKKGSVVKYNGNIYLFWNENAAGKAQLINADGTKFSGTPNMDKITEVLGSFKSVEYNGTEYIVSDKGNIYSGATGNRVFTAEDAGTVTQRNRIIDAAKMKVRENQLFMAEVDSNISDIKSNFAEYQQMYPEKFAEMGLNSVEDIDKLPLSEKISLISKLCRPS